MGKSKKSSRPLWMVQMFGVAVALGIYLVGEMLLAMFVVKGTLSESVVFPITAALCFLSLLCGGLLTVRRTSWGPLPAGLLTAGWFSAILVLVGLSCWEEITWTGRGGILLLCAFAGGILSGILGSRRRGKSRHKRK